MTVRSDGLNHFPPDGRLIGLGLALVAVLYLTISPLALGVLGFNYDETGGAFYEKIHPATFLAVGVLLFAAMFWHNAITSVLEALEAYPGTFVFLATIGVAIAHSIVNLGLPFTFFFDTFVGPVLIFFLFKDMRAQRAMRFVWLVHTLIVVNALVGIFEYATGARLTPLVASGLVIDEDWRSTALLGHPLSNASLTGAYILMLALGAGRNLPSIFVVGGFVISTAGMVVFGGRASSVLLLVMLAAIGAVQAIRIFRGARFNTRTLLIALFAVPVVGLALVGLAEAGVFDQFLERFVDDQGSADTRVEMFELFKHLSWYELFFLPNPDQLTTLKRIYGIEFGIESLWISFILTYGIVPAVILFAGLFAFCRDLVRAIEPGGLWVLAFFFIVASTSVSLSAKTPLFAVLTLMLLVLMRRDVAVSRPAAPADGHYAQNAARQFRPRHSLSSS